MIAGWAARARGLFNDTRGPWGPSGGGSGGNGGNGGDEPPGQGPWGEPPRKRRTPRGPATVTSLDELLRRGRAGFGGEGGGFPWRKSRSPATCAKCSKESWP